MVGGKCAYVLMLLLVAAEGRRIARQMKMLPTDVGGSSSCWMVLLGKMRYVEFGQCRMPQFVSGGGLSGGAVSGDGV